MNENIMKTQWDSDASGEILEMQAIEQRRRIHHSVGELRTQVQRTLDVRRQVRDHIRPATAVAAGMGVLLGFRITGFFTRSRR